MTFLQKLKLIGWIVIHPSSWLHAIWLYQFVAIEAVFDKIDKREEAKRHGP